MAWRWPSLTAAVACHSQCSALGSWRLSTFPRPCRSRCRGSWRSSVQPGAAASALISWRYNSYSWGRPAAEPLGRESSRSQRPLQQTQLGWCNSYFSHVSSFVHVTKFRISIDLYLQKFEEVLYRLPTAFNWVRQKRSENYHILFYLFCFAQHPNFSCNIPYYFWSVQHWHVLYDSSIILSNSLKSLCKKSINFSFKSCTLSCTGGEI